MRKKRSVQLRVDPLFKRKLKIKAINDNKSLVDLTREIAVKDDPFESMFNENEKKRKKPFRFDF